MVGMSSKQISARKPKQLSKNSCKKEKQKLWNAKWQQPNLVFWKFGFSIVIASPAQRGRNDNESKTEIIHMKYKSLNILFIIFQSAAVILLTYTLLFKSIFSSIDSLDAHLQNAGVYNHLAAMIKQALIIRLPNNPDHLLGRALAINVINSMITPEL